MTDSIYSLFPLAKTGRKVRPILNLVLFNLRVDLEHIKLTTHTDVRPGYFGVVLDLKAAWRTT